MGLLKPPGLLTFAVSLLLGLLALVSGLTGAVPLLAGLELWAMLLAWLVLVLGCTMRGM